MSPIDLTDPERHKRFIERLNGSPPTMLEKVTDAILDRLHGGYSAKDIARAAIEAMREPTEAMELEAIEVLFGRRTDALGISVWRAMIDEALKS